MNGLEGGKVARDGDRGLRQPLEGQSLGVYCSFCRLCKMLRAFLGA